MTDEEMLLRVVQALAPESADLAGFHKGGRLLLGVPRQPEAAARTFGLYQPQRLAARVMTGAFRVLAKQGLHHRLLPKLIIPPSSVRQIPDLEGIDPCSRGVLLGSPEHKVRRAVATYRTHGRWEVAKITIGVEGNEILETEARALNEIRKFTQASPVPLGLHRSGELTLLRMSYLSGMPLGSAETPKVLGLLDSWKRQLPEQRADQFDEWPSIKRALSESPTGESVIPELASLMLQPMVRHGDFARWNLLGDKDGSITALDWEWGNPVGMPGLDLVHYFLQDQRLVLRLPHAEAIAGTLKHLRETQSSLHLVQAGWPDHPILPVIASLAYKQGAGHQENRAVLDAALSLWAATQ